MEQLPDVDIFVACVGSGGTFSGVSKRLKEYNSSIRCVAGEPRTSAVLSGQKAGPHKIQGIGANFIPANFDNTYCDDIMLVDEEEAITETKRFAKETGILVGISSGANIALARRLARYYPNSKIVTNCPDGGEKYLLLYKIQVGIHDFRRSMTLNTTYQKGYNAFTMSASLSAVKTSLPSL